jgi:hypothetical protein
MLLARSQSELQNATIQAAKTTGNVVNQGKLPGGNTG